MKEHVQPEYKTVPMAKPLSLGALGILCRKRYPFLFFAGHIFLLWGAIFILVVDKYRLDKKNLIRTIELTTLYHVILLFFNILINANYDYLITPPILQDFIKTLPQSVYSILAIILLSLIHI